ncbi:MAG: hypothetical protein J1D86_05525 [Alistipes sp.]|nr:hypothetical protein [Alistipes sp.]
MKKYILSLLMFCAAAAVMAQEQPEESKYRRSALYSMLVSHNQTKYAKEIEEVFSSIPIPEKFDNHDLSVKIVNSAQKKVDENDVSAFLKNNDVARRMVARWFDRDPQTGECDMELVMNRGLYDASYFDVEAARMSQRGFGVLADAGEELIGNTFVLVNDIRYTDKQKTSRIFGSIIKMVGAVAGAASGNSGFSDLGNSLGSLAEEIKGFGVSVTSYLYRLEWNDEVADEFYSSQYVARGEKAPEKAEAFAKSKAYSLKYVGSHKSTSGKISMRGVSSYDPIQMIRKVCTRAIDESIVALQREYDEFKIKTPVFSVTPAITAKVGLKEGISERNKYEVLEQYVDKEGRTKYRRVGVIQPVKGKIWDNRYMALEENAEGSKLEATTFRKVSGGDFYPGMLIREIKVK